MQNSIERQKKMASRQPRHSTRPPESEKSNAVETQDTLDQTEINEFENDQDVGQQDMILTPMTLNLSRALVRKLIENAREEGITAQELATELVAEGVTLRAWEIVEKKAAMRGGTGNQGFNRPQNVQNGNHSPGNSTHGNSQQHTHQRQFQGGNKMAQKKLQRQARQHANAMDLMSDKAAFIEYVRNQEKKRR
jgi:hypothetical protein